MPAENTVTLDQVTDVLTKYKEEIKSVIDEKVSAQSTVADTEIGEIKAKLDEVNAGLAAAEKAAEEQKKGVGLPGYGEAEKQEWSWQKFFTAQYLSAAQGHAPSIPVQGTAAEIWTKHAPFERDACKAYMEQRKKSFAESLDLADAGLTRDANSDDGSAGGFLVPPQQYSGDIVDVVYAQTPILDKFPVLRLDNLMGDLPIPTNSGHYTGYWLGETEAPTKSNASWGLKWLRAKKLGAYTKVSNRLLAFSDKNIEMIIKNSLARDMSVELSAGLTTGTGSNGEPKGLTQYTSGMTSAGAVSTNGAQFRPDDLGKMKLALDKVNEQRDTNTYGALMRPEALWGMMRAMVKQYSGQARRDAHAQLANQLLMTPEQLSAAYKMSLASTTQLSAAETTGTSSTTSSVYYGDWSLFAYATFRDPIFRVSDVAGDGSTGSAFLQDQLYMVMFLEADCNILREAAFAYATGAECTESSW